MAPRSGQTRGNERVATPKTAMQRLERWMPAAVRNVIETLAKNGARAVLVGGGVRDAFLGRAAPDWDVATDAPPERVAGFFRRVARTGEQHGTIMVLTGDVPVEVTTFRGEGPYLDGRRPSHVVFLTELEADLARRDLTINAMAYDVIERRIVDPFEGLADLRAGRVRCVGKAAERFAEDGLRPLRAARFAATLGFDVEPETAAAMRSAITTFERVAWERKRVEMEKLLGQGVRLATPIGLLESSGMLAVIAPELAGSSPNADRLLDLPRDAWLRFCGWINLCGADAATAGNIATRWRASKQDARRVEQAVDALMGLDKATAPSGADLRRWVARHGWPAANDAGELARVLASPPYERFPTALRRLAAAKPPLAIADLAIDGSDLARLGLAGPAIGATLKKLLGMVLENPGHNDRDTLLAAAQTLSTADGHM
jgi:tRNA nucleotidyltransferase (CCA-adding enzyme)